MTWQTSLQADFYPRPPRGGRLLRAKDLIADQIFLSTPSARRATGVSVGYRIDTIISIHALREEGDWPLRGRNSASTHFYPRPPRGGRRPERRCAIAGWPISIHALREEGDRSTEKLLFLSS